MKYLYKTLPLKTILFCLLFASQAQLSAQSNPPKREFRAVWIATVNNIDYPRKPIPYAIAQKEQWKKIVEKYKELGFNALIVQIRPAGDAFYPTAYAPWSKYLTGQQGLPPQPLYNPLEFMIEETHKQGMEFHAWLNPYRATVDLDTFSLAGNHMFFKHPEWMLKYGGKHYFNPALPEVRQHLTDVVGEVVKNYDIDAIHFDDYFYPYRIKDVPLQDTLDYIKYGAGFEQIDDWRRDNVDQLIEEISYMIKQNKPHVKFGISPFGVWRNRDKDPRGSDTRAGVTSFDDLYANVLKWMNAGWIDYIVPQLYWSIGFEPADHEKLLRWWSRNTFGKHLYIGHAVYKVADNNDENWHDPEELPRQIRLNRRNYNSLGSAFFSAKYLLENPLGVKDSIDYYYKYPALLPEVSELSLKSFSQPTLKKLKYSKDAVKLRWKPNKVNKHQPPAYYVIYRFEGTKISMNDYDDPRNIIAITPFNAEKNALKFYDETTEEGKTYTYAITAVNRQHSESKPSMVRRGYREVNKIKNLK